MQLPRAKLEHWMREFYFSSEIDLGSSGVATYSFGKIQELLDITQEELANVSFDDSFTRGCIGLRKAIADRWGNGDPEHVMTSNGSNEILYHMMSTMLQKDDEVILLDPIYHALSTIPESIDCKVKYWKLHPQLQFRPSFEELRRLVTPKTKMLAVNFPHNPTGVTISREQQKELIKIAAEVGAYLVWDAAFEEMTNDTPLPNPFLEYNKAISVGTLSKGYGLPGLRIGWCFAPPEILESCVQLRDYTTLYISPLIELIGQRAIEKADLLITPCMQEANANRKILEAWISDNKKFIEWSSPDGGVTCLIKFQYVNDTEAFCRSLAKEHGVMLVPGNCFGQDSYIRLGFGETTEKFKNGLGLLSKYLNKYWR